MKKNESYQGCGYCACHSPIWKILEEDFINSETISNITKNLKTVDEPKAKAMIFTGGIIRPLIDGKMDTVEAIGFNDKGRVVTSGTLKSVQEAMKDNKYEKVTLKEGETLLPGFIDPHMHIGITALIKDWYDFGAFDGQHLKKIYNKDTLKEDILNNIPTNENDWLLANSVDPSLMPFEKHSGEDGLNQLVTINCDFLDNITEDKAPNTKIFMLSASVHTAYLNTNALIETFNKSKKVRDKYGTFEKYKEDTKGVLQELEGMAPAVNAIPDTQIKEMVYNIFNNIEKLFNEASMRGNTMLYDASMTDGKDGGGGMQIFLEEYLRHHKNNVRVGCAYYCDNLNDAKRLDEYKPASTYKNLYRGNIKLVSDGSNQGLTGFQCKSYCCEPKDNIGIFNFSDSDNPNPNEPTKEYIELMQTIVDKGWNLMVHANGDKAIDFLIKAYDIVLKNSDKKKNPNPRHRIEHSSLLTEKNIDDMKRLNLSPSFLIGHVGYWGYVFKEAIFEEKAQMLDLCKSSIDKGLRISLHSDKSVTPLGSLRMMEQAITRRMESPLLNKSSESDKILNKEERISAEEALRAVTYDAAWQCGAGGWVGSLKENHYADFVILKQDPIAMKNYVNMRDIPVLETWKGGVRYYQGS